MTHYHVEIDASQENTSHAQVLDLVGSAQRVLDVGCAVGDLGAVLQDRGCAVYGIEIDPVAAELARTRLTAVEVANLDNTALSDVFPDVRFDVVIFADVLEHLVDPAAALRDAKAVLAPGGRVVISIPNTAHGSLRLGLLQGRWEYNETGLLDRTHIKFYTRESLADLVTAAGYDIEEFRGTTVDPLAVEVKVDTSELPIGVIDWVRRQRDANVYQFQLAARPASDAAAPKVAEFRPVVPGLSREQAALPDGVRVLQAQLVDARLQAMRLRDRVIGLEAALGSQEQSLRAEISEQAARAYQAEVRILEMQASTTWRVGQKALKPVRWFRRQGR